MNDKRVTFLDKCFKDTDGIVRLSAQPNLPLYVFVGSALIALLAPGIIRSISLLIAFGSIFTWAWLELFDGLNYFRKFLGAITLAAVLIVATLIITH